MMTLTRPDSSTLGVFGVGSPAAVERRHSGGRVKLSIALKLGDISVLFFNRPRSEGWPHHGRTFSIYPCPLNRTEHSLRP